MTHRSDQPAVPAADEVRAALERAEEVREQVETYRESAEAADEAYTRANEHRSPSLDEMPFGEELIRTEELPSLLAEAEASLNAILEHKITGAAAAEAFQSAIETIEDATATLEDCAPVSGADGDDE